MVEFLSRGRMPTSERRASARLFVAVAAAFALATAALAPASSLAAGGPQVNSINPIGGRTTGGTSVVIRGARFSGATAVKFGATNATSFSVKSSLAIAAVSPAGTGAVDVTVTTPEGTSTTSPADVFTYGPQVTGVAPNRGPADGGTSVTITGSDFTGATAVEFGSSNATSVSVNSDSSITAVSPEGTGTVDVTVITPDGTSTVGSADRFTYVPAPVVTSVSPPGGPEAGGTEVTITVTEVDPNEVTAVDFGMVPASFFVNGEGSITAFSPAGSGAVDVTVTAFGGTSLTSFADQFSYVPAPTVTGVSPDTGPPAGGTTVTITGTNLAGATAVDFGSSAATDVVVNSENSISAVSPIGTPGETVDVTVTTPGGKTPTNASDRFRYLQSTALLVKSVTPNSGALVGGTPVLISGNAFVGATAVDFGSAAATSFTVKSQHVISAVAPAGTGTVDVTVSSPEGVSPTGPTDQFSYVPAPPTVEKLVPAEAAEKGGRKVAIKGTNLSGATAVSFGSTPASSFVVNARGTTITAIDPPAEVVGKATVDVTVTTAEGTSAITPADRFTYELSAPIVTRLSAHRGPATGGTSVTISGKGFVEVTAVDFGAVSATSFAVSPRSITATAPPETVGKVKVTVITPAGVSGPGECSIYGEEGEEHFPCPAREIFTFNEPTVTGVTPNSGSTAGGTAVTITGTGFGVGTAATEFRFGGTAPATSVDCTSITTCTAVTAPRAAGTVDVRAKIPHAPEITESRSNPPADQFTYN
jgi:IPT/TIG domain